MGDAASVSSLTITLPKGGGALHGFGDKFFPDLHAGTGNVTVPITSPAGRNGLQHELNLTYRSGNGHGLSGFGCTLRVLSMRRKIDRGIFQYNDARDVRRFWVLPNRQADDLGIRTIIPVCVRYRWRNRNRTRRRFQAMIN